MDSHKTLFNASFEESKKISPNLFSKNRPFYYSLGIADSMKMYERLSLVITLLMFSGLSYALGIGLPETADMAIDAIKEIFIGAQYFQWLKYPIVLVIILFSVVVLLNILPKKNYMVQRIFGIIVLVIFMVDMLLSIMPMLLGITLGATGWLGFSIICVYGIAFFVNAFHLRIEKIKQEMYGKDYALKSSYISNIWARLKKVWLIAFVLIIINILTLRIGMWGEFNLLSLPWLFAGPIYFGLVTVFICGPFKMFVTSFYFAKYAQHYRVLWQVSDEQWYGKRKAKKLAKKKLKLEKRGK